MELGKLFKVLVVLSTSVAAGCGSSGHGSPKPPGDPGASNEKSPIARSGGGANEDLPGADAGPDGVSGWLSWFISPDSGSVEVPDAADAVSADVTDTADAGAADAVSDAAVDAAASDAAADGVGGWLHW